MNLGAVSDEVSERLGERVAPAHSQQGYGWLLDAIHSALADLPDALAARAALIEFAVRGVLLLRLLCPGVEANDLFLDIASAARTHTAYPPRADALATPALFGRLLEGVSQSLQRPTTSTADDFGYQALVEAVALAEIAVALYDASVSGTTHGRA